MYVGMTGLSPEERFEQHRSKHKKAARPCKKYGVIRLRPELYVHLNPMTYAHAQTTEIWLARHLREQGYGVWQN